jgi:hypothetical protein
LLPKLALAPVDVPLGKCNTPISLCPKALTNNAVMVYVPLLGCSLDVGVVEPRPGLAVDLGGQPGPPVVGVRGQGLAGG